MFQTVSLQKRIFFFQQIIKGKKGLKGVSYISLISNVLVVWSFKHMSISAITLSNLNSLQKQFSEYFSPRLIFFTPKTHFFSTDGERPQSKAWCQVLMTQQMQSTVSVTKDLEKIHLHKVMLGFWWKLCSIPLLLSLSNTPALLVCALNWLVLSFSSFSQRISQ